MALEAATTINQLVITNPLGTDNRSQGDDHIRLIKSTLKNTFPQITSPVTVTQDQINALGTPGIVCFPGMIVMWSGQLAQIPGGWRLCNGTGTLSNGNPVPDLRGKFIIGSGGDSGSSFNTGATGGSASHNHTIAVQGTALTNAQMPNHAHSLPGGTNDTTGAGWGMAAPGNSSGSGTVAYYYSSLSQGGGQAHTHQASATVAEVLPPYYALAFIVKE